MYMYVYISIFLYLYLYLHLHLYLYLYLYLYPYLDIHIFQEQSIMSGIHENINTIALDIQESFNNKLLMYLLHHRFLSRMGTEEIIWQYCMELVENIYIRIQEQTI